MYVLSSEAQIVSRSVSHGWWLSSKQKKSKIASGPVRTGPVWILPVPPLPPSVVPATVVAIVVGATQADWYATWMVLSAQCAFE